MRQDYDYIIAGMGCAGLSLAVQLKQSKVHFSKILLIDKTPKNTNDRTWCFWTKTEEQWYAPIIHKKWNHLTFAADKTISFDISPYRYCLIRGIDFYNYCLNELSGDDRFEIVYANILKIKGDGHLAELQTTQTTYTAKLIFNSAIQKVDAKHAHVNFVQHFKGWKVVFEKEVVDVESPVFMDFGIDQKNDCRFVYTIPYSKKEALIEYTGFSKQSISVEEYDAALKDYIQKKYKNIAYQILEEEQGQIPMFESAFINPFGPKVVNIGTAGNASKASSGYTFYFIQKAVKDIVNQLQNQNDKISLVKKPARFHYYDKVLLDVLNKKEVPAKTVFEKLFQNNKINDLLDFLNEESTVVQDLKIINSLPKKHFIFSGIKKLWC